MRALVENAMPEFLALREAYLAFEPTGNYNATYDDAWDEFTGYGAAMQFEIWEILLETNGVLNLQQGEVDSGTFYLDGIYSPGTITGPERTQYYGIQIADKLQNGTWTDPGAGAGNFQLLYGDSATYQDRLFVTTAIPEPTSLGLALTSSALLLFRRRRAHRPPGA